MTIFQGAVRRLGLIALSALMLPVGGGYCADAPVPKAKATVSANKEARASSFFMLDLRQTPAT